MALKLISRNHNNTHMALVFSTLGPSYLLGILSTHGSGKTQYNHCDDWHFCIKSVSL